jgi:hypothetical protein
MALRTVNPWLDHRHDARPSGYRRSARCLDELTGHANAGYSLLPTIDSKSPARGGRESGSEKASSRREQRSQKDLFFETPVSLQP